LTDYFLFKDRLMKKILAIILFSLLVTVLAAGPATAQGGMININGQVFIIDDFAGTLTIITKRGDTLVVAVLENFDFTTIEIGDSVLIKAHDEDGTIVADFIKQIGGGDDDQALEARDLPEGSKDNSAFCSGAVQEKSHPLAFKIAERYGMAEEDFMDYFCDGYSIGAVMLALKTSQLDGSGDPLPLLESRALGNSWGHIWKENSLIGKNKTWDTPPGLLNRPDHAGGVDLD
jgi:hypothetical protein